MAYDPELADRVRAALARRRGVAEQPMFGGLAFLLEGRMFCGVLGQELLARVGPAAHDAALARPHVRVMDFTGRPMRGYVFVGPQALRDERALRDWVRQCAGHAATLPPRAAPRAGASRRATGAARPTARPAPGRSPKGR